MNTNRPPTDQKFDATQCEIMTHQVQAPVPRKIDSVNATVRAGGRPKKLIVITPEHFITALASAQCSKVEVAHQLGISVDTFDRRPGYAALFTAGRLSGRAKLRQMMVSMALEGNPRLLIFLAKSILGWKETGVPDESLTEMNSSHARERLAAIVGRAAEHNADNGAT
jgi:hypothetical protein